MRCHPLECFITAFLVSGGNNQRQGLKEIKWVPLVKEIKISFSGVLVVAQRYRTWIVSMRMWVGSLASLTGLRIRCCRELWCRSQMQLRSCIAVAVAQAGSCSSYLTPHLGTRVCRGCDPKKKCPGKTTKRIDFSVRLSRLECCMNKPALARNKKSEVVCFEWVTE